MLRGSGKGDDEVWGGQERTGGKPREEGEWKIVWCFFCHVGEKNRTSRLGKTMHSISIQFVSSNLQ